ncbi:unnamed protein product, partial [Rotaria sp. Silwood2]
LPLHEELLFQWVVSSDTTRDFPFGNRFKPMLNLYQEEKCHRIESEKQAERLVIVNYLVIFN